MLFKDVISLMSITYDENDIGDPIEVKTKSEVFADRQSIRQSEFYQAAATGLKPELMFVIRTEDYNNEPFVEYDGKEFKIIRTYTKDCELLELICQGVTNEVI